MTAIHVVPVGDLFCHLVPGWPNPDNAADPGEVWQALAAVPDVFGIGRCPCGPVEDVERDGHGSRRLVLHHALDGRTREAAS